MKMRTLEREVIRPIYIGSFGGPRFGEKGRRLSTGMPGKPGRLHNNRSTRRLWKAQGSPERPVLTTMPSPSPERGETNRGVGAAGKGSPVGFPCETLASDRPCKRKAIVYGPKKARLCWPCVKAAWMRQGYCPLQVVVIIQVT